MKRADGHLHRIAEEQAALRRVATLVAHQALPAEVFATVAEEVQQALDLPLIVMARYEPDDTIVVLGATGEDHPFRPGARFPLDPGVSLLVRETGRPARVEYEGLPGAIAKAARQGGFRAALGVPIVVDGAVWGAIAAVSTDEQPLPNDTEARLVEFTELVGTAIANAEAHEGLRRLVDEQAALRRVAVLVAGGAPPDEVFAAVAHEVAHLLDVPAISMVRFERDETATAIAVWGDENPFGVGAVFQPWPGVMLQVRQTGRPARLEDFAYSTGPTTARLQAARIHSGVGVPITVEGRVWGTIIALATGGESLPIGIEERLSSFTELVATAIANTEARDDLRRLVDEQAALRRVATLVAQGAVPRAVFDRVCEETGPLFGATSTNLCYFTPDGFNLTMAGWSVHDTHVPTGMRLPLDGDAINVLVRRTAAPGRVDSYEGATGELAALLRARGIRAEVGAPVIVEGQIWGTLIAGWDTDEPAPAGIEHRVARFAELIATAIANAEARDELRELAEEQAALRRVATLVAQEASPDDVFAAVAEEILRTLDLPRVEMARYEPDGTTRVLGAAGEHPFQAGTQWPLDGPTISALVRDTGRPARIDDYSSVPGTIAQAVRDAGIRSGLGVPIVVGGRVWGMVATGTTDPEPLPPQTEGRLIAFTELIATAIANAEVRDDVRRLAEEQASLRRVATLVAEGTSPADVFAAVADEVAEVTGLPLVEIARFDPDGMLTVVGAAGAHPFQPGTRWPLDNPIGSGAILETRRPSRIEYTDDLTGTVAAAARDAGIRWALGVPIIVDGRVWGSIGVARAEEAPLPVDAVDRLVGFTELVATAVSNATTHSQLLASRARIVTAGDEARRRIERNLHDGTQQRLVSLGLDLQTVRADLPAEQRQAHEGLDRIGRGIESVLEEVREFSRGLHPALLTQGGLEPALRGLARKSPIRVELDVDIETRPPEAVEIATYYVVSEALANSAKHAQASRIAVLVSASGDVLRATIVDDGIGGAEAGAGSGLIGLTDRVEALGGRLALDSRAGCGTRISIELPLVGQADTDSAA
ncbi:MAG TPA: GAF domain-containing protein [Terrimesophilobacter sp.]|uniref:GAF domain-containing sensor histidine kinase n=1 Tax=Terrimesophilobacter sp. TaxID=2906435 RepID=UPI002F92C327